MGERLGTILVVDDVETVLTVTRRLLERIGWRVVTASTGVEAVRHCQELHALSAVLLDGTLLDLSGEETLARIRAVAPELPVVIMTGDEPEQARARFSPHGVRDIVSKPFRPTHIESALAPFSSTVA